MSRRLSLFCLFCIPLFLGGQGTDLREMLRNLRTASYYDSTATRERGEEILQIAEEYGDLSAQSEVYIYYGSNKYYGGNFKEAKEAFRKALELALEGDNEHLATLARIRLGYMHADKYGHEEGEKLFLLLLDEAERQKDIENQIECYNALSIMTQDDGREIEAAEHLYKGLHLADSAGHDYYTGVLLNNLGLIRIDHGMIDEAHKDFQRAYDLAEKTQDFRLLHTATSNLGMIFMREKKTREARELYAKMVDFAKNTGFARETGVAYANLAWSLLSDSLYDEAIHYYDSAAVMFGQKNLRANLTKVYLGKGLIYRRTGRYNQALAQLREADSLAVSMQLGGDLLMARRQTYQILKETGRDAAALSAFEGYVSLRDSLEGEATEKEIAELGVKYETEKNQRLAEDAQQEAELLRQSEHVTQLRIQLGVGLAVFVLVLIFVWIYIRWQRGVRKRQEAFSARLIETVEKERGRIARDLHDDIGQSLSAIKSRLSMKNGSGNENLDNELSRVIEKTRSISHQLYPSYLEKVGLVRSVARLSENTQRNSAIQCSFEADERFEDLPLEVRTHLYRILQECVNNTLRHAQATALKIFLRHRRGRYTVEYIDNGRGLRGITGDGMGLASIRERCRMIGAEMLIPHSENSGFKLIITL